MKPYIMFVDDSFSVHKSIKWIFRDEPYYLFAFASPLDALSVIDSQEFSVVVADQSMVEMDGIEFFKAHLAFQWVYTRCSVSGI